MVHSDWLKKRVGGEKELCVQRKNDINPSWCQGPVRVDEFVLQVNPRRRIRAGDNSSDRQICGAFMVASIEVFRDRTLFVLSNITKVLCTSVSEAASRLS